jgi:hypothetical protein
VAVVSHRLRIPATRKRRGSTPPSSATENKLAAERARFAKPMELRGLRFDSSVFRHLGEVLTAGRVIWDHEAAGSIPVT